MDENKCKEGEFVLVKSETEFGFINVCPVIGLEMGNLLSQGKFKIGINYEDRSFYLGLKPKTCKFCGCEHRLPELFPDEASVQEFYEIFSAEETLLEGKIKYILIETEEVVHGKVLVAA